MVFHIYIRREGGQPPTLVLNSSREEIMALPSLYHRCDEIDDFMEFDNMVLPMIIDVMIIQRLIEKNAYVKTYKRQSIRKNLLNKVKEELRSRRPAT